MEQPTTALLHDPAVRPASYADAEAIAEIYNESIRAGDATMDEAGKTADEIRANMERFDDQETYLVFETEGAVAGWGIIKRYSDRAGYRFACETSVYFRRHLTGKGYGTRLQEALLRQCRAFGYHHVVVKIFASNTGSIKFHGRLGFDMVGIQREIGYKRGAWKDVAIMQCVLPT
jgi:phosphinothricin acetyltransferase